MPVWFVIRGGSIVFDAHTSSVKAKNLRNGPRIAITVDEEVPARDVSD